MHGRVKVRTSEEQAEAKRKEQQEKLKIYLGITGKIFAKREANEFDEEALELCARVLEKNPDFYTLWNYRREILLILKKEKGEEEMKTLYLYELDLTQNCLKANPKSYSAWHHRQWIMEFNTEADWRRELKLCNYFLSKDERNFHCWDYRRIVCKKCNVSAEEELDFSTQMIETNFSNYSAWHYRSTLLPLVHWNQEKNSLKEDVLLKEFDIIQNAAFTDPEDQSVWFYHRWLLGRSKTPLHLLNVSVIKPQNKLLVLLSEPVKVDSSCLLLTLNGDPIPVTWRSVSCHLPVSMTWICDLPTSTREMGDTKGEVCVQLLNTKECNKLSCDLNAAKSYTWGITDRTDMFRLELSAATKDVLEKELESCQQLNELEPDCKWTLFTCVLLMRALNNKKFQNDIREYIDKLTSVDAKRKNYYKDLGSKFVIEDLIESFPLDSTVVDLSNRHLTSLHHFDQFILIEKIDLSSNNLISVVQLSFLVNVKVVKLDDNQLTDLEGLEHLDNLESLSVKRNDIQETGCLNLLKTCSNLQELFIEGNPVINDSQYIPIIKTFSHLKLIDGSSL